MHAHAKRCLQYDTILRPYPAELRGAAGETHHHSLPLAPPSQTWFIARHLRCCRSATHHGSALTSPLPPLQCRGSRRTDSPPQLPWHAPARQLSGGQRRPGRPGLSSAGHRGGGLDPVCLQPAGASHAAHCNPAWCSGPRRRPGAGCLPCQNVNHGSQEQSGETLERGPFRLFLC